jgi:hypothetical protein
MSQDPDVAAYQSSNAIVISYVFKYNNQKFKEFNEISLKFKDGSIKPANELEVEAKKYTEAMESASVKLGILLKRYPETVNNEKISSYLHGPRMNPTPKEVLAIRNTNE